MHQMQSGELSESTLETKGARVVQTPRIDNVISRECFFMGVHNYFVICMESPW